MAIYTVNEVRILLENGEKMKVLLINAVCGTGSTGRIVTDLHDVIIQSGGDARIAFGVGVANRVDESHTFYFGSKLDYYVHNVLSRITDKAGFYSKKNTIKLIEYIKSYEPDIIHLHNLHGYYLNILILFRFLRFYNKPVVWTLHDCWAITGHCVHFSRYNCYKWKTQCESCVAKKSYPKSMLMNNAKNNYTLKRNLFTSIGNMCILTPSEWLANIVNQSFLKKYSIIATGNGIDLKVFKKVNGSFREKYNLVDKIIILGVADVWSKSKGIEDYIKLSKIIDNNKYKIVLVGSMKQRISKKMPNNILVIPRTKNIEDLIEIYSAADILLNLSIEETFGMTTTEALACGTPVITYDKTAVPEPVLKCNGFIVKAGDIDELYNTIKTFPYFSEIDVRDSVLRYDKDKIYNNIISIYKKMLNTK